MEYKLVKINTIETPYQGALAASKLRKTKWWKAIKIVNNQLKNEPLRGDRLALRFQLLDLTGQHKEAIRDIQENENNIEKRANELGLTINKKKV